MNVQLSSNTEMLVPYSTDQSLSKKKCTTASSYGALINNIFLHIVSSRCRGEIKELCAFLKVCCLLVCYLFNKTINCFFGFGISCCRDHAPISKMPNHEKVMVAFPQRLRRSKRLQRVCGHEQCAKCTWITVASVSKNYSGIKLSER